MGSFRETLGVNDFSAKQGVWKALVAEYIGNLLLNFFGCAAVVAVSRTGMDIVLIALAFGLTIFVLVQTLGHVSGAHLNPAVTAGMLVTGNIHIIKGLLYIIVQCLGALTGSAILMGITPENVLQERLLGVTDLDKKINDAQGFGMEFFLGFLLVLVVFGVCDPNRPEAKPAAALAIGLAVTVGHLAAVDYTGSSMNPARSFGSAVIKNHWEHHWVYWVGPILGGIVAGLLYKYVFAAPSLGPLKIIERYTTVVTDEKELKRLDGRIDDNA